MNDNPKVMGQQPGVLNKITLRAYLPRGLLLAATCEDGTQPIVHAELQLTIEPFNFFIKHRRSNRDPDPGLQEKGSFRSQDGSDRHLEV